MVAGGGTAGHLVPALAVARALVARGHDAGDVHFIGSARGLEARLVPAAGFEVSLLPGRGIVRRLSLSNVGAAAGLARAVASASALMARRRPSAVLAVGGYASFPGALAAVTQRVPLVLHEQNAVPGLANRLAGRFARASAVSFESTSLPHAVLTGNPVSTDVLAVGRSPQERRAARAALGLPHDAVVVAAIGGSLGSRRINDAVFALVEAWSARSEVAVRHAVGARDWSLVQSRLPRPTPGGITYQPVEFEHQMPLLLSACDVVVARAGGTTVAELAVVGVAAILIPLPHAPGDHQTANAASLVRAGAAVLVPDADLTAERLAAELEPLLSDPARRSTMERSARELGRRDAADAVAELVERHARH